MDGCFSQPVSVFVCMYNVGILRPNASTGQAGFYPRDAMLSSRVRLSVCLSAYYKPTLYQNG